MSTIRFERGPVQDPPKTEGGSVEVRTALVQPRPIPKTKFQIIMISVMVVVVIGVIAMLFSQPAFRSGPMGFMAIFFPLMLIMSMVGYMGAGRGGGDNKSMTPAELEVERRDYFADLDKAGDDVQEAAAKQFEQSTWFHPEPRLLRGYVGGSRMWERNANHAQFGWVRMGLGRQEIAKKLDTADLGNSEDYEEVTYYAQRDFLAANRYMDGAPKPIALQRTPALALVGESGLDPVYKLVRSMVGQIATFHSPEHFKVMVLTDDPERWDDVKWLPHNQHATAMDTGGSSRMVWTSIEELEAAIGPELHQGRKEFTSREGGTAIPHWLVICDKERPGPDWDIVTRRGRKGVKGVTFLRIATEVGDGLEFEPATTLFVTEDEIRDRKGFFAKPDQVSQQAARTLARKLSKWRPASQGVQGRTSGDESQSVSPDLCDILGVKDARHLKVDQLWAATRSGPPPDDEWGLKDVWGKDWLKFPIGVDEYGNVVHLDFKETQQHGMGQHMLAIGTTGSGKSEFLKTIATSMCLTHSPEQLNIAFFDFKGSTTAQFLSQFPHVVAAISNLKTDLLLDRMRDGLLGELERRKQMLHRAGVGNIAEYEYMRIHRGEKLEPMPWLFVIIDEHTQMLTEKPDTKELVDEIGRQGRALGVSELMASQYLGHQLEGTGPMANIPIRIALRTLNENDSRSLIGAPDAAHLPTKPAGAGYLRVVGRDRLVRFQAAYVSKTYVPPREMSRETVRKQGGYVPPELFTAAAMKPLPKPVADPSATAAVVPQQEILGIDGRPLRQLQAIQDSLQEIQKKSGFLPHQIWLPTLEPLPVDELVRRMRGQPWNAQYGSFDRRELRFPVGVEDRPFHHAQRVYAPDLTDRNCAIVGQSLSGKTTALTTMITGAALTYSPKRVQFYVIALSGPALNDVETLPHVGSLARAAETDRIRRSVAEMKALIEQREKSFRDLRMTMEDFRARKFGGVEGPLPADDPFGDTFLVIDGWPVFRQTFESLVPDIEWIMEKGPAHGVHVIASATGWIAGRFTSAMGPLFTANIELKLSENDDASRNPNIQLAKAVPFGTIEHFGDEDEGAGESDAVVEQIRGRGRSMTGFHFQAGLPEIVVGGRRIGLREAVAIIRDASGAGAAADVRMLPEKVTRREVLAQWTPPEGGGAGIVPFGVSEVGLAPAIANFAAHPHLLFVGNAECGKSSALAAVAQGVMQAYTPEQARIFVVDPKNSLAQVVEGAHLGTYRARQVSEDGVRYPVNDQHLPGYVWRAQQARDMAEDLAGLLASREIGELVSQADIRSGVTRWSGPEIFIFVDDEEMVQAWGETGGWNDSNPLAILKDFIERGKDVGLHLVVARRVVQWARAAGSPVVSALLRMLSPGVVMDGSRIEGQILGNILAAEQPRGRGIYVTDKLAAPMQIALPDPLDEPANSGGYPQNSSGDDDR